MNLFAGMKRRLRNNADWLWAGIYRGRIKKNARTLPAGLLVRLATAQELHELAQDPMWTMSANFIDLAIARGDQCVVGYLQEQPVSIGWAGYTKTPHINGIHINFAPGHRYNYKAFTAPKFRGQHLRGSFGTLEPVDQEREVTHSIAFIDYKNQASAQAERRNGGGLIGYAGYLRLGRLFFSYTTAGARRYGFTFTFE